MSVVPRNFRTLLALVGLSPHVTLKPTPQDRLPGTPAEAVRFDIESIQTDISAWQSTIEDRLNKITEYAQEIQTCRDDIERSNIELARLTENLADLEGNGFWPISHGERMRRETVERLAGFIPGGLQ